MIDIFKFMMLIFFNIVELWLLNYSVFIKFHFHSTFALYKLSCYYLIYLYRSCQIVQVMNRKGQVDLFSRGNSDQQKQLKEYFVIFVDGDYQMALYYFVELQQQEGYSQESNFEIEQIDYMMVAVQNFQQNNTDLSVEAVYLDEMRQNLKQVSKINNYFEQYFQKKVIRFVMEAHNQSLTYPILIQLPSSQQLKKFPRVGPFLIHVNSFYKIQILNNINYLNFSIVSNYIYLITYVMSFDDYFGAIIRNFHSKITIKNNLKNSLMQNNKKQIFKVTAPGKVIISGEHSVVYNKNAICAAINIRAESTCYQCEMLTNKGIINILLKNLNEKIEIDIQTAESQIMKCINDKSMITFDEYFNLHKQKTRMQNIYAFKFFTSFYLLFKQQKISQEELQYLFSKMKDKEFQVVIQSQIPVAKGLGSSAAISTIFAATLLLLFEHCLTSFKIYENHIIEQIAYQFQKIYHSNPSGLDNFISLHGGMVIFNRQRKEKQKLDWAFDLKMGVVDSGVEKNTKKAVEYVKDQYYNTEYGKDTIEQISNITDKMIDMVRAKKQEQFLDLVQNNHNLLKKLGLSNTQIQQIVNKYKSNKTRSKITGSGMGGCVLIFSSEQAITSVKNSEMKWSTISSNGLHISRFEQEQKIKTQ